MSIPGSRSPQSDALVPYGPPQDDDQQLVSNPLVHVDTSPKRYLQERPIRVELRRSVAEGFESRMVLPINQIRRWVDARVSSLRGWV